MNVLVRLLLPADIPHLYEATEPAMATPTAWRGGPAAGLRAGALSATTAASTSAAARAHNEWRASFTATWQALLNDDTVWPAAVVVAGEVAGSVVCSVFEDRLWLSGSLSSRFRGRGLALPSLMAALRVMTVRPLHARLPAGTHDGALRLLGRAGFRRVGVERVGLGSEEILRLDFGGAPRR